MTKARRRSVPIEPSIRFERQGWPAAVLLLGFVLYLILFYWGDRLEGLPTPLVEIKQLLTGDLSQIGRLRRLALLMILAPDALVDSWVGDDWSRFGVLDHLPVLFGAGLILFLSFLTGRLILDALRVDRFLTRLERFVFGTAVGLNVWSLWTLAVGLAGALQSRWLFAAATGAIAAASAWRIKAWQRVGSCAGLSSQTSNPFCPAPWLIRVAFWLALPFAILIVWGGTLPPSHFDVREYHLQVPKEWFLQGRVSFMPHNVYGNMPLGAEMHAVLGMVMVPGEGNWWWGALIGKTVIASMAPLTSLAVYAAGARFFSRTAGAIAACVLLSTPWMAHVSMTGLIDGACAFYAFLAVYGALVCRHPGICDIPDLAANDEANAVKNRETTTSVESKSISHNEPTSTSGQATGMTALTGFLAGASVACKYPALLFIVVPLFAAIFIRRFWQFDMRAAVIYTAAVVVGCGLWFGKNWALSGNPTYPLLYRWFDGESWTAEKDARWRHAHGPPYNGSAAAYSPRELWNCVQLLFIRSDHLGPALWPLAIVGLFCWRQRRVIGILVGVMLWTTLVWWLMTHRVDRFLVPLLPLAALIAGAGGAWGQTRFWAWTVAGIIIWSGAACFVYDATPIVNDNRLLIALRDLRTDVPRGTEITRIHHAQRYLNEHVQPGYRALLVGEAQVFDLEVPILYNTCFDDSVLEVLTRGRSREERLAALREHRISHIYVSWHELDRYREPGNYGYSDYPTRQLIRGEMSAEQGILHRVPLDLVAENGEVFEVEGWREWERVGVSGE